MLIAAKLPADAIIIRPSVARPPRRRTVSAPSPLPIAISGASGPSTAPRPSVAKAARMMPGSSRPVAGPPPVWKPNAGECPLPPGRYRMVKPTNSPHSTNQGSGHHAVRGS